MSRGWPADQPADLPVRGRRLLASGRIFDFVAEEVDLGEGRWVRREFATHPGAVAIIALDEAGRVLLQRQYRHPVRAYLWEPPAGLLDVAGEDRLAAAQRELAEEADLVAADWRELIDWYTTPGGVAERIWAFLARDLAAAPQAFEREDEEVDLVPAWVDLDEAANLALTGALSSPSAVVGILAAARAAGQPGGLDALPVAASHSPGRSAL